MSDKIWYLAIAGEQHGPFSESEVLDRIQAGNLGRDAHVFKEGMPNWTPIHSQPEFATTFKATVSPPPGTEATYAPAPDRKRTRSTIRSSAKRCSSSKSPSTHRKPAWQKPVRFCSWTMASRWTLSSATVPPSPKVKG